MAKRGALGAKLQTVNAARPAQQGGRSTNNSWINGSFYLVAVAVLLALIGYLSNQVAWHALPIVLIGGLLVVGVVGASQLRNDELLSEKGFLALMVETYKRLPLLKRSAGG